MSLISTITHVSVDELILVIPNDSLETLKKSHVITSLNNKSDIKLVSGGESRKDSVINGLKIVKKANDIVCIHDAARPFIKSSYIKHSIETLNGSKYGLVGSNHMVFIYFNHNIMVRRQNNLIIHMFFPFLNLN